MGLHGRERLDGMSRLSEALARLTDRHIEELRDAATRADNGPMVEACDRAMNGDERARAKVARALGLAPKAGRPGKSSGGGVSPRLTVSLPREKWKRLLEAAARAGVKPRAYMEQVLEAHAASLSTVDDFCA